MKVSVWAGQVDGAERLEAALTQDVSCHGDSLGSDVSRALGESQLADAVREWRVLDRPTTSTRELLGELSFAQPLEAALGPTLPLDANSIVLFFGVEPTGSTVALPGVSLAHLGVVAIARRQL